MTEVISYKKKAVATLGMATALTWLGLAGLSLTAQAHEVPGKSLRTMTEDADLIFQGVVSKVEYGMARIHAHESFVVLPAAMVQKNFDLP